MALGEQKAQQMIQPVDTAFLQAQKVQKENWLKTVAKVGSGAIGGYGAYSLVNHISWGTKDKPFISTRSPSESSWSIRLHSSLQIENADMRLHCADRKRLSFLNDND
jgi:hypothetical protein